MASYKVASYYIRNNTITEEIPQILGEVGVDQDGLRDAIQRANKSLKKRIPTAILITIVLMIILNGLVFGITVAANKGFDNFGKVYQPYWTIGVAFGLYFGVLFGVTKKVKKPLLDLNQKSKTFFLNFSVK